MTDVGSLRASTEAPPMERPDARRVPRGRPPQRGRQILGGVVTGAAVVGVGVAAYLLAGGGVESETTSAPTTEVSSAPSTLGTSEGTAAIPTDILGLHFDLPHGWIAGAPGSGATGAQLVGERSRAAQLFDALLAQQPSETVLFGIDTDVDAESSMTVSLAHGDDATFEALVQTGAAGFAVPPFELTDSEGLDIAIRGHQFQFESEREGQALFGVQYVLKLDEDIFIITFTTVDRAKLGDFLSIGPTFARA